MVAQSNLSERLGVDRDENSLRLARRLDSGRGHPRAGVPGGVMPLSSS